MPFRSSSSGDALLHCISWLLSAAHIYLPDPTHCEGWDHAKFGATTHPSRGSWLQDTESTSLPLLLTKNHRVLVLEVTLASSGHWARLCGTKGEVDPSQRRGLNTASLQLYWGHEEPIPAKYCGCESLWSLLQWRAESLK